MTRENAVKVVMQMEAQHKGLPIPEELSPPQQPQQMPQAPPSLSAMSLQEKLVQISQMGVPPPSLANEHPPHLGERRKRSRWEHDYETMPPRPMMYHSNRNAMMPPMRGGFRPRGPIMHDHQGFTGNNQFHNQHMMRMPDPYGARFPPHQLFPGNNGGDMRPQQIHQSMGEDPSGNLSPQAFEEEQQQHLFPEQPKSEELQTGEALGHWCHVHVIIQFDLPFQIYPTYPTLK
jgi:hypothetical protein